MNFSYIANQSKIYPIIKKTKCCPPLILAVLKRYIMVFSETGFYLKYKSYFLVRKHQILLENTSRLTPTAIIYIGQGFVRQCPPPDDGPFGLEIINLVQSLCLMSF